MRTRIVLILMLAMLGGAALAQQPACTPAEARAMVADAVGQLCMLYDLQSARYFNDDEWPKAIAMFDQMIRLEPRNYEPYANAAWLLWSTGKHDRAMDYYQRMVAADPDNPETYYIVAAYYFTRRVYADSIPWLEKAIAHGLTSPKRHMYGHALRYLGRTQDALAFWRRVLAEEPEDTVAQKEIEKLTQPAAPAEEKTTP